MKPIPDWQQREVVNVFDEVNLWSAVFGRLLLENIPMKSGANVLDIGFGTGFPLLELSQRFGDSSKIYGIDIWKEAIIRTKEKMRVYGISNVEIFEQSAESIPLPDDHIDLICSNLGVNNFDNKEQVLRECFRVLRKNGSLCITTNPVGTFHELFSVFEEVLLQMNATDAIVSLQKYIAHRQTKEIIVNALSALGFKFVKDVKDETNYRFVNAQAVFDHGLLRIGFRESWNSIIPKNQQELFYLNCMKEIEGIIQKDGEFRITVPVLYLQFRKQ